MPANSALTRRNHAVQLIGQWLSAPQVLNPQDYDDIISALVAESLDKWDSLASEAVQFWDETGNVVSTSCPTAVLWLS